MDKKNKRLNIHVNPRLITNTEVRIMEFTSINKETFKQVENLQVIRKCSKINYRDLKKNT